MRKKLVIVSCIAVVLVAGLGGALAWLFRQPLFRPGQVRAGERLSEPLALAGDALSAGGFLRVAPDVTLYTFSRGSGALVIVVHGGPGVPPAGPWPGLEPLTASHEILYYHQRGCGRSTRPFDRLPEGNTFERIQTLEQKLGLGAQIADLERLRLSRSAGRVILVGHSWGGYLASLYAAEFPERVAGLVLVSPAPMIVFPEAPDLFDAMATALPPGRREAFAQTRARYLDIDGLIERSEAELGALAGELDAFYVEAARARGLAVPPAASTAERGGWLVWAMYLSGGRAHDFSAALRRVTAPVLVIHGERDLQSEAVTRRYLDYFPNARLEVFPHVGHFAHWEAAGSFATMVGRFFAEVER
jgi:proline iminopeptidase